MNRLSTMDRERVLACLVEGNSIRSTVRITGICKRTVLRLLVELGEACERFAQREMRNLPCRVLQCDEVWSFCYAKEKNVPDKLRGSGAGDVWTWVVIDPETKLIPAWTLGERNAQTAYRFMRKVEPMLAERVQLTTDGLHAYLVAVRAAFNARPVDYGMLIKLYGEGESGRYTPAQCIGARREPILGLPDPAKICTSHVERQNLTMRMSMRRFTRLTNGFSKSIENHRLALAIHFVHYNFSRIHQTLRITPAMAAGLTNRVWELADVIGLLEAEEERRIAA